MQVSYVDMQFIHVKVSHLSRFKFTGHISLRINVFIIFAQRNYYLILSQQIINVKLINMSVL